MKNVLLIGPYIGDWKQEILTFRPYAKWISNQLDLDDIFISSHSNRGFLYDWIPEENFVPVYEHLTRNEKDQSNYLHKSVDVKDYKLLIKEFKQKISKQQQISIRDIVIYNLSYLESTPHYSWYQKDFTKIKIDPIPNDYILYIPANDISDKENYRIFDALKEKYKDIYMIGDSHCYNFDYFINYQIDYYETGYINLMKYILGCKMVITPCSYWTMLCNLHQVPVFSWGEGRNYKHGGDYNFDSTNNYILITNDFDRIMSGIEYFKNVRGV